MNLSSTPSRRQSPGSATGGASRSFRRFSISDFQLLPNPPFLPHSEPHFSPSCAPTLKRNFLAINKGCQEHPWQGRTGTLPSRKTIRPDQVSSGIGHTAVSPVSSFRRFRFEHSRSTPSASYPRKPLSPAVRSSHVLSHGSTQKPNS